MDILYSGKTDRGFVREQNQDAIAVFDRREEGKGILFVLADGLGGMDFGDVASAHAVKRIGEIYSKADGALEGGFFQKAFITVNREILTLTETLHSKRGIGTTLTASYFCNRALTVAHVGDSRLYRWRHKELTQLTTDHALSRHTLSMAVGTLPGLSPDLYAYFYENKDRYLQCSDGLYSQVETPQIAKILSQSKSPEEIAQDFIDAANHKGGQDNTSVQVIFCG